MIFIHPYLSNATAKNWKAVLDYDDHNYKEYKELDHSQKNIVIIDNCEEFKNDIRTWKKDQRKLNSYQSTSRRKDSKIMTDWLNEKTILRDFRIEINSLDIFNLTKDEPDPKKQKDIICEFYKNRTNELVNFLEQNNGINKKWIKNKNGEMVLNENYRIHNKIKIVKAAVHFDQTKPHLHLHLSNLYPTFSKQEKREILTCNTNLTDWLNIQKFFQKELVKENKINKELKPNEFFHFGLFKPKNELEQENKKIMELKLEQLLPNYFADVFNYQQELKLKDIKIKKEIILRNQVDEYRKPKYTENKIKKILDKTKLNHKEAKELEFKITNFYLRKNGIEPSENYIENQKLKNELAIYSIYQTLGIRATQRLEKKLEGEELKKEIKNEFENLLMQPDKIKKKMMIEPHNLNNERINKIELAKTFPKLKKIEQELGLENKNELKIKRLLENNNDWKKELSLLFDDDGVKNHLSIKKCKNDVYEIQDDYFQKWKVYEQENNNFRVKEEFKEELYLEKIQDINNVLEKNLGVEQNQKIELDLDNNLELKNENVRKIENERW